MTTICLLVFALSEHPDYPLIIAANRDEFYARPTSPAGFWQESPFIYGGRDMEKGGTWLGVNKNGRFAALTNFRDPSFRKSNIKSRGLLVSGFLAGDIAAEKFIATVDHESASYNGFNLIIGNSNELHYFCNRNNHKQALTTGIYGLSNHFLDTPWPKLKRAKERFQWIIDNGKPPFIECFDLLADRTIVSDEELPNTGVSVEWERTLSPIFIASDHYGTRSSTVVLFHRNGEIFFHEKRFGEMGRFVSESKLTFERQQ